MRKLHFFSPEKAVLSFSSLWCKLLATAGFLLAAQTLFSQNIPLDSLEQRLAIVQADSQKLDLLSQMTSLASRVDYQITLQYAKRGVVLADKIGDNNWQPKFYEMQGRMHANLGHLDSATLFLTRP